MKKLYFIPELLLTIVTLLGFSYGLVAVFKEPGLDVIDRILVASIGVLGFLTSLFVIGYIIRKNLKKEEIDEEAKNKKREEEYELWLKAVAESENSTDPA